MRNPFFVARLGAFTLSLLLLLDSLEPGYGIDGSWGWYLGLFLLTLMTGWDLLSFIACVVAFLLLLGILDESRAAYIVLTIFTGVAALRPRGPNGAMRLGYRVWSWRGGRGWDYQERITDNRYNR
ncbi:MAG TPA: hypothetical protein VIB47_13535 [Dehalococcoidia bacterium]|jgi:hypothetical protein